MKITTDASSVVMSYELINGIQRPSALNLFELARLVEGIIIHDHVTVLDTSFEDSVEAKQLAIACKSIPGDVVSIERMSVYDLITRYVDKDNYGFSRAMEKASDFSDRVDNDRMYDGAVQKIDSLLLNAESAKMKEYETLLEELHNTTESVDLTSLKREDQKEWVKLSEQKSVAQPGGSFSLFGTIFNVPPKPPMRSEFDAFEDRSEIFDVYCRIYRKCDPTGGSGFAQWRGKHGWEYQTFARSMFSRANLYILGGELLGAPYRPGALRWPICWQHFTRRSLAESSVAESFVRLAEKVELAQAEQIKTLLSNGTISFTIPLFLRVVMKECTTPDEILKKAVTLRWSPEASRFRALCGKLTQDLEKERFDVIIRDLSECSRDLQNVFGLENAGANWSLLSAPAISMKPHYALDQSVSLGATGKTAFEVGSSLWKWWRARRYGLVIKAAKSLRTDKSLTSQVRRLFDHKLNDKTLDLIAKFEGFGSDDKEAKS